MILNYDRLQQLIRVCKDLSEKCVSTMSGYSTCIHVFHRGCQSEVLTREAS